MQMAIEMTPDTALTGWLEDSVFLISYPVLTTWSRFHHMQTFSTFLNMI
jgi:hypothetical protein